MRLRELAKEIRAELIVSDAAEDADPLLTGVAPIDTARPGQLTFLTSPDYEKFLSTTAASAVILKAPQANLGIAQLVHKNPYYAMAKASQLFFRQNLKCSRSGISPMADIHPTAKLGKDVVIYPYAFVGEGASLGNGVVIYPFAYIGDQVCVGDDTVIHANVTIGDRCQIGRRVIVHAGSAIGPDGFGFAPGDGEIAKIPQTGIVVLEDDVEIGGVCSIDRATMGETRIGRGTKLDSHVHIAHNVKIGENCLLCGASKVAGSTEIGNWCVLGGDAAVVNNIRIVDGVRIGAKAGVTKSLLAPGDYMGFPAIPAGEWRRQLVAARRYEKLEKRLSQLENAFKEFSE